MISGSIGRYQLIEEIGRGGMATVYRAHDPLFKRDVAIKLMTQDLLEDPTLKARFEREAQTIAALEHPAIVPVYDFGEEGGRPFLVMRLMTGNTLSSRLQPGPLSIEDTLAILGRIGSALDRAHQKGIIHRDLKPSNIMFDDYGDAFLADFGIARLTESAVTLTGDSVIGTPAYMSPEQIHGDKAIDGRSDIYALGVICFEMLTGEKPYVGTTPTKIMMRHILDPVPNIRDLKPDLPDGVDSVIAHTMAKDPEERYKTSQEMTDTLEALLRAGFVISAPPAEKPVAGTTAAAAVIEDTAASEAALEEAAETTADEPGDLETEMAEQPRPAASAGEEPQFPETEVMVPSFVGDTPPETEIAAPSFVGAPGASDVMAVPAASRLAVEKKGRNWLLIGAVVAVFGLVVIGGLFAGGIFLFSQSGEDEGEDTREPTAAQAAVRPTSAPTRTNPPPPEEEADNSQAVAEAEANLERFYYFLDDGDNDQAMEAIERAISLDPENNWYRHERAYLLFANGEMDAAIGAISEVIDREPEAASHYELRATIFRDIGDNEAALADNLRAIELDSATDATYHTLGDTYAGLEAYEEALNAYNKGVELNPNNSYLLGSRAWVFELVGDDDAAIQDLERAIQLDPNETWPFDQLASLYRWSAEDLEAGEETWDQGLSIHTGYDWGYNHRGEIRRELGDLDGSLEDLQRAVELNPDEAWFHLQMALTYVYKDEMDQAMAEFDRATQTDPENPDVYYERANIFRYDLGDVDAALADYSRAIDLDPEAGWRYVDRATLYKDLGDFEAALEDLDRGISLAPHDSWLYMEKAATLEEMGEFDAALDMYNQAVEIEPENPSAFQYRANFKGYNLGDYDSAMGDFENCLAIDPNMPWCFLDRGWMLNDIGDVPGAIENLRRFIEVVPPFDCPECVEEAQQYIDENS